MPLDDVGLLFKFRAESKQAQDEIKELRKVYDTETKSIHQGTQTAFLQLGQSYGITADKAAQLRSTATLVAGAVGTVGTVAVGVGASLFALAKNASDAGSEINDLKAKTGLGAESLSALKFAAEQSGSSVTEAAQAFVIYQNKLTDAAAKGKDLFGIDARKALADQEYALRSLTALMNGPVPAGYSRSSLAAELMGRSGSNLIATFDTMGSSFESFLEQARRMGVVLSEDDVRAADEFGDQLTVLETQLGAVANKMALQFAPEMTKGMKSVGDEVTRNKDLILTAGHLIGESLAGLAESYRQAAFAARTFYLMGGGMSMEAAMNTAAVAGMGGGSTPGGAGAGGAGAATPRPWGSDTQVMDAGNAVTVNPDTMRPYRTAEEMQREREQAAKLLEQARATITQAKQSLAETIYQQAVDAAQAAYQQTGNLIDLTGALKAAEAQRWEAARNAFEEERYQILATEQTREMKAAKIQALDAKVAAAHTDHLSKMRVLDERFSAQSLQDLQLRHRRELELEEQQSRAFIEKQKRKAELGEISFREAERRITADVVKLAGSRQAKLEEEQDAAKGNAEAYGEITHKLELLKGETEKFVSEASASVSSAIGKDIDRLVSAAEDAMGRLRDLAPAAPGVSPFSGGLFDKKATMKGPWVDPKSNPLAPAVPKPGFLDPFLKELKSGQSFVSGFGGVVADTFGSVTRAVGQAAAAAMVYGQSFGQAMKMALKAAMASIAAESIVQAIVNTAKGFAALAGFMPGSAAQYFTAAALWGAAGVAAGAAGAAIGGGGGGGSYSSAGTAFNDEFSNVAGQREDNRTRYNREQGEQNQYTRQEDRRGGDLVVQVDGRTLMRIGLDALRDGGDLQDGFRRAVGVPA